MTREWKDEPTTEWMQAVVASEKDLLAELVRACLQALITTLAECYKGVSTRKVAAICRELFGAQSTGSRVLTPD